ncbi:kinase-like domain-containing protein [Pavlovales sp. CCMP2436]|nr:kinase-like domain-containing protein [Pavlovales sp. CCMP2436]
MTAQPGDQTQPGETQFDELAEEEHAQLASPHVWARLVPLAEPTAPKELVDEAVVVGRSREKGCHLVFSHARISSRHCEIRRWNGQALLTDTSQNGTFVNSYRIAKDDPVLLQSGDEVALLQPRSATDDYRQNCFVFMMRPEGLGRAAEGAAPAGFDSVPGPRVSSGVDVDALLAARAAQPVDVGRAHPAASERPSADQAAPPPRPAEAAAARAPLAPAGPSEHADDLLRAYELHEELGKGAFAVVRRGVHRQTGEHFAIKVIAKKRLLGPGATPSAEEKEKVLREAKILKRMKHEHVVKLYDVIETHDNLYLVMELVNGGELFDDLCNHGAFPEQQARELTAQLLSALGYLHAQGIAHRDLKPENILLAYERAAAPAPSQPRSASGPVPRLKLADFGLAKMIQGESSARTFCGTPQYFAPEVLESRDSARGYGTACDMWSAGVILYILLSGQAPFEGEDIFAQVRRGQYALPHERWQGISMEAKHILSRMMMVDPARRITVDAALRHPWMRCEALSEAELLQLAHPANSARGVQASATPLAIDEIEEQSSEEEPPPSKAHRPHARPASESARPSRPKASAATLTTSTAQPTAAQAHPPLRNSGSGLMAPPKAPGAAARSAPSAVDAALAAKRKRVGGGSSVANRLPLPSGPLLGHAKHPLVSNAGRPPLVLPPPPPLNGTAAAAAPGERPLSVKAAASR